MEKLKSLLTSKKFWTLVAALVAALTAFFTTSCAAQAKIRREGIHIDTVRVDYIIRSKNFQTLASCSIINQLSPIPWRSIPESFLSIPVLSDCIFFAPSMSSRMGIYSGFSIPPMHVLRLDYKRSLPLLTSSRSIIPTMSDRSCSKLSLKCSSNAPSLTFGEKCLTAFVPILFLKRSRRGGRRGKGRPKGTKSIPLGGSHL